MTELFRRLAAHPAIATELLLASLFANVLALASPIFVIQVLNRYVSYGVDATLATLTGGVGSRSKRRPAMLAAKITNIIPVAMRPSVGLITNSAKRNNRENGTSSMAAMFGAL